MSAQKLIGKELFEEETNRSSNEMLEIMEFMKHNGVPLTDNQAKGILILQEHGLEDIAEFALAVRPEMTPTKKYFTLIDKFTMADKIKGTAKLGNILKAQVTNPNNSVPQLGEAKGMRERDLR